MPTYKYAPADPDKAPYFINMANQRVFINQEFEIDGYLSKGIVEREQIEFVKDEPYITPIIASYYGGGTNALEVPDSPELVDILVNVPTGGKVKIYFNNENPATKFIVAMGSGPIFRSICTTRIRVINTESLGGGDYSIAVVPTTQYNYDEIEKF